MKTTTRSAKKSPKTPKGANKKNQHDHQSSTPKAKLTAEEKAAARARAREAMGDVSSPVKTPKKKTPVKTPKKKTPVKVEKEEEKVSKATAPKTNARDEENVKEQPSTSGSATTKKDGFYFGKPSPFTLGANSTPKESTFTFGSATGATTLKKTEIVPELTGIAKILMVDIQQNNARDVLGAIFNLWQSLIVPKADSSPKNVKEADLLGAGSVLVQTMDKWSNNVSIQRNACICLAAYATSSPLGVKSFMKCGGIEAIVNAMVQFPSSVDMQAAGCQALASLFHVHDYGGNGFYEEERRRASEERRRDLEERRLAWTPFVLKFEGIALIMANAIKSLDDKPDALVYCAALLVSLLNMSETKDIANVKNQIRKTQAPTMLFNASQKHMEHGKLRKEVRSLSNYFL